MAFKVSPLKVSRVSLRPVGSDDRDFLAHVYSSTRLDELSVTGWPQQTIEAFLRMQFDLQDRQYRVKYPQADFAVILVDDCPAGRLYVDRQGERIHIIDISLLPEFRGKGVGSRLLQDLLEEADAKGVAISLHVERNNPASRLYSRLGFRHTGESEVYRAMQRSPRGTPG
ncbi:MAG: GNAT family N-acetyltransferase [Candidatus Wallbacteria bacterium]|nr:GNAT family N-acetyltransferase [Candidatus Wallbacteria bacterium]MBI4867368.1 GNAT family N-acetyltransferase [Candidatus Wallbacteria bacterium]